MAYYNIYFSPTGGTKKVADILINNLTKIYEEIDLSKEILPLSLNEEDVCVISVPSFGGRVPQIAIQRLGMISGNCAKAILNCVYGNREWEDTLTELQDTLNELGFICVAAVAAVAEHSIFRQFATGRPDEEDRLQLIHFAHCIQDKLNKNIFPPLTLQGNHTAYKPYGKGSFKPEGDKNCTLCGLCASRCPVNAIDSNYPNNTDKEKCISCMRCVQICPNHARDFDAKFMEEMATKMTPLLGGHKENHLFL